ncbi:unnamed protein product [Phytophthora fragariaefolia]|uniref:Unnamed protein product n=1 Tax=Phytophthora fragariaefolia TaxID=1490495 RepID=A0A9W6YQ41_9STRA|nr:unnamed protein product [Phytophthora fragariaefolia]
MAEFAINNSVHVSTGHTPFYVNVLRHPRVPSVFGTVAPSISGGGYPVLPKPNKHADMTNISAVSTRARSARSPVNESSVYAGRRHFKQQRTAHAGRACSEQGCVDTRADHATSDQRGHSVHTRRRHFKHQRTTGPVVNKDAKLNTKFSSKAPDFVQRRQPAIRFVQDVIAVSVDQQKLNADNNGRGNTNKFKVCALVLLATQNLEKHAVSDFGASKLAPRFIGPFTVLPKHGNAYKLDISSSLRLHSTFYVGRVKPYAQHESPSLGNSAPTPAPTRVRKTASFDPRSTCTFEAVCETCTSWAFNRASSCLNAWSGGVQLPLDDQRILVDQTRGVFPPPPPPLRDAHGATHWIAQRIVGRQIRTQGPDHFRIRWLGFPPNHDTWEPRNVLMRVVPEMMTEYEARHHQSRRRA